NRQPSGEAGGVVRREPDTEWVRAENTVRVSNVDGADARDAIWRSSDQFGHRGENLRKLEELRLEAVGQQIDNCSSDRIACGIDDPPANRRELIRLYRHRDRLRRRHGT